MATISTKIDDQLKARAEEIADSIGISLSAAINIFLRRFVVEEGFPFEVKACRSEGKAPGTLYHADSLEEAVKRAVADPERSFIPEHFTYFDPKTQKPVTVYNRKEP